MRRYAQLLASYRSHQSVAEVSEYGVVHEGGSAYPLMRLTVPGERMLVITSGFHGEEPAGPLTVAEHFAELAAYARSRGVGLRVYPCVNPSGFEAATRYNASGENPNNDFLRYEIEPGRWVGELRAGQAFLQWKLQEGGPKETRALIQELDRHPAPAAALDIHQDHYLTRALTYAYVFGPQDAYRPLLRLSALSAKVAVRFQVDDVHRTDDCGLIRSHDGSVTDYFYRRSVPYTAALETTTRTPLASCHVINMVWMKGFVDLAARS